MTKAQAQYSDVQKTLRRLKEAVKAAPTVMNQDATIQRFEFTFEACWKLMQTLTKEKNKEFAGPRNALRQAATMGLIDNPTVWLDFLNQRNLTVHTYKEEIARVVYKAAKEFVPYVEEFLQQVKKYLAG